VPELPVDFHGVIGVGGKFVGEAEEVEEARANMVNL
jgi:hypothetical protein